MGIVDRFYFDLSYGAKWIWDHRNEPQYFEWEDLTDKNLAADALNLSYATAWNIFTVLESKGLLHQFDLEKDGNKIRAFKIDLSNRTEWADIVREPDFCWLYIERPARIALRKSPYLILWIFSLLVTVTLTSWIDSAFK